MANAVAGAGFMPLEHYSECERVYLGIENIHSVRQSYLKVFQYMLDGLPLPLRNAKVEADWTKHYATVMEGVRIIVEHVNMGTAVLVHCSDGWDRTAQLVSLSQICLDPDVRTIRGFLAMLQRDWVAAGHQFEARLARSLTFNTLKLPNASGHAIARVLSNLSRGGEDGRGHRPEEEYCPIFPQFLDCLMQFQRVYPTAFEFDRRLIDALSEEVYLTRTDTFRFNCERERAALASPSCFWTHILSYKDDYTNRNYSPTEQQLSVSKDVLFYL
jgi:hypothetical protein